MVVARVQKQKLSHRQEDVEREAGVPRTETKLKAFSPDQHLFSPHQSFFSAFVTVLHALCIT